jgi:hypothetical protein
MPVDEDEKETKRKKQFKRMGKILGKVWDLDAAFQESDNSESGGATGQKIDQVVYRLGRHGWEDFACDLGGVYNRHIKGYVYGEDDDLCFEWQAMD